MQTLAKQKISILIRVKNHTSYKSESRTVSNIIRFSSGATHGIATVGGRKVAVALQPDQTWFVLGTANKFKVGQK